MIKIIIHGWWWKRFFKKHRDIKSVMEMMLNDQQMKKVLYHQMIDVIKNGSNKIYFSSTPEDKNYFYQIFQREND